MKRIPFIILIAATLLPGCTRMKIASSGDPLYPYGNISTFQWKDASTDILQDEETYLHDDLKQALHCELTARGWTQVLETNAADVQVIYYLNVQAHQTYTEPIAEQEPGVAGGLVYKPSKRVWDYEQRDPDVNIYTVELGTLHLQLFATGTTNRVWNGTLKTKIDRSIPAEKQMKRFHLMAHKLVGEIP